jgi:hypothetical protein
MYLLPPLPQGLAPASASPFSVPSLPFALAPGLQGCHNEPQGFTKDPRQSPSLARDSEAETPCSAGELQAA